VHAERITFKCCKWNSEKKIVEVADDTKDCIILEGQNDNWQGLGEKGKETYYAVKGDVKRKTLNCFGEVHIILTDGSKLTCTGGIKEEKQNNAELHIHSQSYESKMGALTVTNSYQGAAGIGGATDTQSGEVYIHGGNISATGGKYGAGIGGGNVDESEVTSASEVYVFAGSVKAFGGHKAAGIGSGSAWRRQTSDSGKLYVYGGSVEATGGDMGAGVGGGGGCSYALYVGERAGQDGGEVYVYGGSLKAVGGSRAAGIGAGSTDTGKKNLRKGGVLRVYGGTVNATGGDYGAGIGGGCNGEGADVEITGGTVWAKGGKKAAGIGGGEEGLPGKCRILGGKVTAIIGEDCKGRNAGKGSAIGYGKGKDKNYNAEMLKIGDNMSVTAGDAENNIERTFTAPERTDACQWRNYALIDTCKHKDATYTIINGEKHRRKCTYCTANNDEDHDFGPTGNHHDCACGQKFDSETTVLKVTIHYPYVDNNSYKIQTREERVARNKKYTISAPPEFKGMVFMGYTTREVKENEKDEMWDSEEAELIKAGQQISVTDNVDYYARYRYDFMKEWEWNDDYTAAKVTITNTLLDGAVTIDATCQLEEDQKPTDKQLGRLTYKATATYETKETVKEKVNGEDKYAEHKVTYTFTDEQVVEYYNLTEISLDVYAQDNEDVIEANNEKEASVTIHGITLKKDGKLHPLCLPFSVKIEGSPLEGATIYYSASETIANNELQMTFKPVTDGWVVAGEPYFVKWAQGTTIENPTFTGVYINDGTIAVQDQYYELGGTYDLEVFDDDEKVYSVENGKLTRLPAGIANAFTSYIYIPREKNDNGEIAVTSLRLTFEGDATLQANLYERWEGEGTAESPYIIYTREQLQLIATTFSSNAESVTGKYFRQAANIAFDKTVENNFTPISNFNGYYDGDGYIISGLNINKSGTTADNDAALFSELTDKYWVKNMVLANSTITGRGSAGIAVNLSGNASVENCHVLKDVTIRSNYYAASGLVQNMYNGTPTVSECSSQATVISNQSNASGIVGTMSGGQVKNCFYLGQSLTHGTGLYHNYAIVGNKSTGTVVTDCYFTSPTLQDSSAKLMPDKTTDNTNFLTRLAARDKFLTEISGLTEELIGYDITLNNRTTLSAVQNADGTWQSKAYSVCLPFNLNIKDQFPDIKNITDVDEYAKTYKAYKIDLHNKELIFTYVFPELTAGEAYVIVVEKGSIALSAKNVTVVDTPVVSYNVLSTTDNTKPIGGWMGTFKRIENDEMIEKNVFVGTGTGKFRCPTKGYKGAFTNPFVGYFTPLEALANDRYIVKYVCTGQADDEEGEVTDFPSKLYDSDFDFEDDATGIPMVSGSKIQFSGNDEIYNLNGQRVNTYYRGIVIKNGKKIFIK